MFAKRILQLEPSPTITLDTKAKALIQQGVPVINLSAGEPDFDTPQYIKEAAITALKAGFTKYASPQGLAELRQTIAEKIAEENGVHYDSSEIIIGTGSKQLLYTIFQALCNPGDEVIIPIPTWGTFVEQVKLAEGKPVLVKLNPPFKVTAKDIEKKITNKTKIVLLNSPSNPTGAMIESSELKKIAGLAIKNDLWIIADEIYEKLIYQGKHVSVASLNQKIKERTIMTIGVSKSYAMTGWRLGYAAGPLEVIKAMTALQSQTIGNVPVFIQKAAETALTENQSSVHAMHKEFTKRRTYLLREFAKMPEFSVIAPEGAFYFFVSVEKLLNKEYPTSATWCEALLEKAQVAVVPGEAFFYPGYFRLSFAASMEDLREAMKRMKKFIA